MKKSKDIYILIAAAAGIYFLNGAANPIKGILGFFDNSVIKNIDDLKKEYFRLAKIYHPDAGGNTQDFQTLLNEYQKLLKTTLKSSNLSDEDIHNEEVIDEHIRAAMESVINLPGINIELVGKWIWISGNTYPIKEALKAANFIFIKKDQTPFWVFKGVESTGRGKMSLDEIKSKYGAKKYGKKGNYISGISPVEFYYHIKKLQQHLKNRK